MATWNLSTLCRVEWNQRILFFSVSCLCPVWLLPVLLLQVWTASSKMAHKPPVHFLWKKLDKFIVGPQCTTILCNPSGQVIVLGSTVWLGCSRLYFLKSWLLRVIALSHTCSFQSICRSFLEGEKKSRIQVINGNLLFAWRIARWSLLLCSSLNSPSSAAAKNIPNYGAGFSSMPVKPETKAIWLLAQGLLVLIIYNI